MNKNYYQILGLESNCTKDEIKKAYKYYATKFHPDKHKNDEFFEEKFLEIKESYDILIDDIKRKKYDDSYKTKLNDKSYNQQSIKDQVNQSQFYRFKQNFKNEKQNNNENEINEIVDKKRKTLYYADDKITINGLNVFVNNKSYKIKDIDLVLIKKSDSNENKSLAFFLIIIGIFTLTFFIGFFFLIAGIAGLFYKEYNLIFHQKEIDIPILKGKKKYLEKISFNIKKAISNN